MEKLNIKDIIGYLPYQLQCLVTDNGSSKVAELCGLYENEECVFYDLVESGHGFESIKPYVTPLSSFTDAQWIEVFKAGLPEFAEVESGYYVGFTNKVVIVEYKQWTTHIELTYDLTCCSFEISDHFRFSQLFAFAKLYELHGDLHNLIEKGLALNKGEV